MSVIGNLSKPIWFVTKYLRLFVETYLQILWQKYLDTFRYPYHSLKLARLRKKFNFFIRFYYYSDSNIKVKSCEEPPSPQPCPFFLQKTGQRLFLDLTDVQFSMHSTLLFWEIWIKTEKQFYYFFAFSSSSSMYLSKSDIKSLS